MSVPIRVFLVAGAVAAGLAVGMGAFGNHVLRGTVAPDRLSIYQIAVSYHFYHAFALLITGGLAHLAGGGSAFTIAGSAFLSGLVLFSGSLYLRVLLGASQVGVLTPVGGLCFLVGWFSLAYAVWHGFVQRG